MKGRVDNALQAPVQASDAPEVSVVVSAADVAGSADHLEGYRTALDALGLRYEVICAADGSRTDVVDPLLALAERWPALTILALRPWNGDDAGLVIAIRRAGAPLVLTLSGWPEIEPADLHRLFDARGSADMVVARREDAATDGIQGLRRRMLDVGLRAFFGRSPTDPFCRVRLAQREILEEVAEFGVRQHFLSIIAAERGYHVVEADVRAAAAQAGANAYVFKPIGHLRALFDAMTLFVVLKFLRRPLRFFGSIGLPLFVLGSLATLALVSNRLFGGVPLADRPALIFAVLMVVLGVQIIAIGLVGEIIVFANARRIKQYEVREVIRHEDPGSGGSGDIERRAQEEGASEAVKAEGDNR